MGNNSDYIKEIENYFLSHSGKGIMLSSADYSLITGWKQREIPKEVVLKGINRAFEDSNLKSGQGGSSIKSIRQCVTHIENSIIEFSPVIGKNIKIAPASDTGNTLDFIILRLNEHINSEKEEHKKYYYRQMKEILLSANDENPLSLISGIEEESLEKLFMRLDEIERAQIIEQAKEKLGSRARHMTGAAIEESIISFRNEILAGKYNLRSILSFTEGENAEEV